MALTGTFSVICLSAGYLEDITDMETMMHRLKKSDAEFGKANPAVVLEEGRGVYIPFGCTAIALALEKSRASCPKSANTEKKPKKEEKAYQSLIFLPVLSKDRDVEVKAETRHPKLTNY